MKMATKTHMATKTMKITRRYDSGGDGMMTKSGVVLFVEGGIGVDQALMQMPATREEHISEQMELVVFREKNISARRW